MSETPKDYISGPPLSPQIPDCSVAEHLIPLLKAHPKGTIIQEDAETGFAESSMEFLEKSLKVCEGIRKLGFRQNDVIVLLAKNSSDVYAAALGTLLSGSVLAPLNADMKLLELQFSLKKIKKPFGIICEESLVSLVNSAIGYNSEGCKIIVLAKSERVKKPCIAFEELLKEEVDVENYVPLPVESPSEQVALMLPTSGSTGMPKAVQLTHRNVIFISFQTNRFDKNLLKMLPSCLVVSHFYWISCVISLLFSIQTTVKRIYMTNINNKNILETIDKCKPSSIITSTPALMQLLMHPDREKYNLSSVKIIALAGCPITQSVIDSVQEVWKGSAMIQNCYGMSEVSGMISSTEMGKNVKSVGKLSMDVKVKIVDVDTGKSLGPNQVGEIVTQSNGLMKGYLGDEEATKEIITDGWCRTGDLGYYDDNENLYVVERFKEMIKTKDGQTSPAEIENVIGMMPGVKEAGVVGMLLDTLDTYLVALVVKKDESITEDDVRNFLKDKLLEYKLPKYVRFVNKIPRSEIGKLLRRDLKALALTLVGQEKPLLVI